MTHPDLRGEESAHDLPGGVVSDAVLANLDPTIHPSWIPLVNRSISPL
jgi:hypothetical protein